MILSSRIKKLIKIISEGVYEKEEIFRLAMLALLSGESIFLLGKPGIAKSLIARRIKNILYESNNFEYLMNRFSSPEEIFGPISIKDLLNGKYVRLTDGYLPTADVAFLDEIWKAGPSIQNTLLTIINEKIFRNGTEDVNVPLKLLISASNELPESGKGLEALFDRFIIRIIVFGLNNETNFNAMLQSNTTLDVNVPTYLQIKETEYQIWLKQINKVKISEDTFAFIARFRKKLDEATNGQAYISDRRWKKIVKLIKASAFYEGRKYTTTVDLLVIPYCIWDDVEQEQKYTKLFNELFVEELTFKTTNKIAELEAEIAKMQHELENLEDFKETKITPSVYKNPFNYSIQDDCYRIIWDKMSAPIAFIRIADYNKMLRKPQKVHRIKIYFGTTLNQLLSAEVFHLLLKNKYEIWDDKYNKVYAIELHDTTTEMSDSDILESAIIKKQTELDNLRNYEAKEINKLKRARSLFFDEQYRLLLETAFIDINFDNDNNEKNDNSELELNAEEDNEMATGISIDNNEKNISNIDDASNSQKIKPQSNFNAGENIIEE